MIFLGKIPSALLCLLTGMANLKSSLLKRSCNAGLFRVLRRLQVGPLEDRFGGRCVGERARLG
jgi:hypothetical protein